MARKVAYCRGVVAGAQYMCWGKKEQEGEKGVEDVSYGAQAMALRLDVTPQSGEVECWQLG